MDNPRTMEILGAENTALFNEFLGKIKGKSVMELPPILVEFKARLPQDMQFTAEQKDIIIEEALFTMPMEERNRYKTMLKILNIV